MDFKWAEKILKYRDGIDIATAIKNKLEEYVEIKIYIYIYGRILRTIYYR